VTLRRVLPILFASVATFSLFIGVGSVVQSGNLGQVSDNTAQVGATEPREVVPETFPLVEETAARDVNESLRRTLEARGVNPLVFDDDNAWVDRSGEVYFVDERPEFGAMPSPSDVLTEIVSGVELPLDLAFSLESRPSSLRTIYLNFVGGTVTNTSWNVTYSSPEIVAAPFDLDGDASRFTDDERAMIINVWQRVSEDFAAFDVNVTTENPGVGSITRSNISDEEFGTTVMITSSADGIKNRCRCGGVAYLDVFDRATSHSYFQPAWAFYSGNPKAIAESVSHEIGHNFGLSHDGNNQTNLAYYEGHGSWGSIMGLSLYRPVVQWSSGEYLGANNQEDDLAIIAASGAPLLLDDHGNSLVSASSLPVGSSHVSGLISTRDDVDIFTFSTTGGPFTAQIAPSEISPNLAAQIELLDGAGSVLASVSNLEVAAHDSTDYAAEITALALDLEAGTYFLRVDGIGVGDVQTGFSDYGSLGVYGLAVSIPDESTPMISGFGEPGGYVGDEVVLYGQNLSGVTGAVIGDVVTEFEVLSTSAIRVTIPSGATTDFVEVSTPDGVAVSARRLSVYLDDLNDVRFFMNTLDSQYLGGTLWVTYRNTGSTPGLRCFFRWQRDGTEIAGEFGSRYTPRESDLGSVLGVAVTCKALNRETLRTTVTTREPLAIGPIFREGSLSIAGEARVGATLTLTVGAFNPTPDSIEVTWTAIGHGVLQVGPSKTLIVPNEAAGRQIYAGIRAVKRHYQDTRWGTSGVSAPVTGGILSPATATVAGSPTTGGRLSCLVETDNEYTNQTVRWFRDDSPTEREVPTSLTADDVGHSFTCSVTLSKYGYNDLTITSAPSGLVEQSPLQTITGLRAHTFTFQLGPRVTWQIQGGYSSDSLSFDSIAYAWYRGSELVASTRDYVPTNDDAGHTLRFEVSATKSGYDPITVTTETDVIQGGRFTNATLTVEGNPRIGETLSAVISNLNPVPDGVTYTWRLGDEVLQTGPSNSFVVPSGSLGQYIYAAAYATKSGFEALPFMGETARVSGGTLAFESPVLTGEPAVGNLIELSVSRPWTDERVSIRWLRNGKTIEGTEDDYRYQIEAADLGKMISASVTFTRDYHDDQVFTLNLSSAVAKGTQAFSYAVINGQTTVGSTLSLDIPYSDGDVDYSVEWLRNGQVVDGARDTAYPLAANDVGKLVSARVTAQRFGFTDAQVTTNEFMITNLGDVPTGSLSVIGKPRVGKTLNAVFTSPGASLSYQWSRNGRPITGATKQSYKIAKTDKRKRIGVTVTASRENYTTVTRTAVIKIS
jgi:hypothetical protein